ncbi:MAG: hypothetical protein ABR529_01975 [Actinomycetota bacterium]
MPVRFSVRLDEDVEGHGGRFNFEDLTGKAVTIRTNSGDEVQGHLGRWNGIDLEVDIDDTQGHAWKWNGEDMVGQPVTLAFEGSDAEVRGHGSRWGGEDATGQDTEGHGGRYTG